MLLVLDQAQADLGGPELRCPDCPGRLRRWGFARARSLRCSGGGRVWLRPRRVRCASCRVSHVLLPALAPPYRAYTIDLVGAALLASAGGQGHRGIGTDLGVPPDTVRGWIRRVKARAEWLRVQGTIKAHMLADDLRRLGTHGLIERIPHTHRYQVTDHGLHTAIFLTRLHDRLIPTDLAHLANQSTPSPLRSAATAYQNAIDNLTNATGLAA